MRSLVSLAGETSPAVAAAAAAAPEAAWAEEDVEGEEEDVSTRSFSVSSLCIAASFFRMLFLVGLLAGAMIDDVAATAADARPAAAPEAPVEAPAPTPVDEDEDEEATSWTTPTHVRVGRGGTVTTSGGWTPSLSPPLPEVWEEEGEGNGGERRRGIGDKEKTNMMQ